MKASPGSLGLNAYLTACDDARLFKLYIPRSRDIERGGGIRGKVTTFSHGSRKRMMEKLHRVRREAALPKFVTLTFPDFFPDQKTAKRRLDTLFKRWRRRWPGTAAMWRMEVIDRKSGANAGQVAPHFHLLVWGAFDAEVAAQDWVEVNGTAGDYAHFKHGTKVDDLETWRGAAHYCAKYCAKTSDYACEGRVWGVHNRKCLPVQSKHEETRVYLPRPAIWRVARLVRKAIRSRSGRKSWATTLFTDAPQRWVEAALREEYDATERANCDLLHEAERLRRIDFQPDGAIRLPQIQGSQFAPQRFPRGAAEREVGGSDPAHATGAS